MALSYQDIVAGQGGTATNAQTGAVTTATPTGTSSSGYTYNSGSYSTSAPATTTAIPADQMGASTAIKVPGVSTDTGTADATAAGATQTSKSIQDYLKEITPPETATSKQYGDLLGQINTLLPDLANKSKDQLAAEEAQNLPQLKQDLAALNSQILTRNAEYEKLNVDIEGKAIPLQFITGQQAQVRRQQASEIGLLQARALGLQGQVQMAQETANRAIDLKYDSLQDTLNVKLQQLELIQPLLDKEERQYAQALELKYRDEQRAYEIERQRAQMTMSLAMEQGVRSRFVNRNGEFMDVNTGKIYGTPEEFFRAAGVTSFEEAYARSLVTDIDMNKIMERGSIQNLMNSYPDAGITLTDTLSSAQAKLSGSRIYNEQVRPPSTGGGGGLTPLQLLGYQNQIQDNMRQDPVIKAYSELVNFGVPTVIDRFNSGEVDNLSDTVLMRTLAKVTDPTTGVREEEYRTFETAQGALGRLYALPSNWIGAGRLTDTGRQSMIREIQDRYNASLTEYIRSYQFYSGQAGQLPGISISPPLAIAQQTTAGSPLFTGPTFSSTPTQTTSTTSSSSFIDKAWNFLFGN